MSTILANGLNPQAQSFISIGVAAFIFSERAVANNDALEDATSQSPLVYKGHFSEQQNFRNAIDWDILPDVSHESGPNETDTEPAREGKYSDRQLALPAAEELDDWFDKFFDIEDESHEDQLQIKAIELLYPSGFIALSEADLSSPFHPASRQLHALHALLPDTFRPSRNSQLNNCRLHDTDFINHRPSKLYTTWLTYHLEISDHLFRSICPADLNNTPCEWDELPTGCPLLRLCCTRRIYPIPSPSPIPNLNTTYAPAESFSFSFLPVCHGAARQQCIYIHDITPNCRSIDKHASAPRNTHQPCPTVAAQSTRAEAQWRNDAFCSWGHDFEGARLESLWRYWEHRAQARRRGSVGLVKRDRRGRRAFVPKRPDVRSLAHVQEVGAQRCSNSRFRGGFGETGMEEIEDAEQVELSVEGSAETWTGSREGRLDEHSEDEREEEQDVYNYGDDEAEYDDDNDGDLFEIDRTRFVGRTFHGHYVRLSFELGEKWTDGWYYTFRDLRAMARGLPLRSYGWGGEVMGEICEDAEEEEDEYEDGDDEETEDEYTDESAAPGASTSGLQSSADIFKLMRPEIQ